MTAYSYMSLVPIIQPPVMRLLTTEKERKVRMPYSEKPVSKAVKILFPILVTVVISLFIPQGLTADRHLDVWQPDARIRRGRKFKQNCPE